MNQLSDLELVAQAMSGTTSTSNPNGDGNKDTKNHNNSASKDETKADPSGAVNGKNPSSSTSNPTTETEIPNLDSLNLNLDPKTLTSLSSLMSLSDSELEQLELDGDDDGRFEEIMKQLEMADGVAEDLEGKLDRLLETLGGVENDIVQDQDQRSGQGQGGEGEGAGVQVDRKGK